MLLLSKKKTETFKLKYILNYFFSNLSFCNFVNLDKITQTMFVFIFYLISQIFLLTKVLY